MSPRRGPLAPQNERRCAEPPRGLFACISACLSRFVRFNDSTNAVECYPPAKRSLWRVEGGGKGAGGRASDCGLSVDLRVKAWGKALENLCVKLSNAWTIYPSSTPSKASQPRQETPVHNAAIFHSRPTPLRLSSSSHESTQSSFRQGFGPAAVTVIHCRRPALLL